MSEFGFLGLEDFWSSFFLSEFGFVGWEDFFLLSEFGFLGLDDLRILGVLFKVLVVGMIYVINSFEIQAFTAEIY